MLLENLAVTHEFCTEIFRASPQFIEITISQSETAKAIEYFKQDYDCNIPQAFGETDDTHIFIQTPENEQKYDYYCHVTL